MGNPENDSPETAETAPNFVRELIAADVRAGKHGGKVVTRFPPEPSGYLHLGHAKAIHLNTAMAAEFSGHCNLRFDDTNPSSEEVEFVEAIKEDVRWLGMAWDDHLYFASDYFERLYEWAVQLVDADKAYVDSQTMEQIRENRGNYYREGVDSPFRTRSVAENRDLLQRMKQGEFPDGAHVLRAKIDMKHSNLNMRDPLMYRIRHAHHHRSGDRWCIYPMYDWAHGQSDAIEGITHSLCTLEFEDHRILYEWYLQQLGLPDPPRQIEFAKLNVTYTVLGKRRLARLVQSGEVSGWDDPRMPTLAGLRRRGYTPAAIRNFVERVGVAKRDGVVDITLLEHALRDDLNASSPRVMAVLRPLKLIIVNYPDDAEEEFDAPLHPEDPAMGTRKVPFCRELWIEREDFAEVPPRKWFRLAPGKEIRLRYACLVRCVDVVKNDAGEIIEVHCEWDPNSRGGTSPDGRKVRGTSHWVSARHGVEAEVNLYDRLFRVPNPTDEAHGVDFLSLLNPASLETVKGCYVEPSLVQSAPLSRWQFERLGYFCRDRNSTADKLVFNRTIALKDGWARIHKQSDPSSG